MRNLKPKYVDPFAVSGTDALAFRPPILFRDVTARVFPLKANIARLTQFCDEYLNLDVPDTIVRFTPALPYVYFMVLDYGGMSATTMEAQRLGWVAQHEILFLVPLQRWRREHGKLVFKGWTGVAPFIFVDDPMSQITGREVYGWPKVQAWIDADKPFWAKHPRSPTRLFTMSANVFASVYAGREETRRELVTVDRDMVASYAEFPADLKCPWSITSVVPNVIRSSLSLMGDAIDIAAGLRIRGYPPGRNLEALVAMTGEAVSMAENMLAGVLPAALGNWLGAKRSPRDPFGQPVGDRKLELPRYFTNSLNLKQFRDPGNPELACYTALVDSAMGVERVNQIGLLGDWDLLRGDPSGGYSISIHRYQSQPIIDSLGIEIPNAYRDAREGDVATLRPTFPFWMDVDLYYGAGHAICSHTNSLGHGDWIEETQSPPSDAPASASTATSNRHRKPPLRMRRPDAFNTALGAATEPVVGPFHFPDVTLQVYPLLADPVKLAHFVECSWNRLFPGGEAAPLRLELLGSYVYMTVSVIGDKGGTMWSNTNNLGWWAEREVAFCIPVKWMKDGKLISVAMIEPFVYANKNRAVITDREVNGRNSMNAVIESPADVWMSPHGPAGQRRLARVATESFVALGIGQKARERTLLEIDERHPLPPHDIEGWREVADGWGSVLADELRRKSWLWGTPETRASILGAQNLALDGLARGAPVNRLTLKQYCDAGEPDRVCYQAVVHTRRAITNVHGIREIERPVHVWMTRLPNHPIVEALGLRVKLVRSDEVGVVDCLQPIRPFWMRIGVEETLGSVIATVDPHRSTVVDPTAGGDVKRVWVSDHPWFVDGRPASRSEARPSPETTSASAEIPFFLRAGAAPLGANWNVLLPNGDRRGLRGAVALFSRRALTNELAWKKCKLESLPDDSKEALRKTLEAPDDELFLHLLDAGGAGASQPGPGTFAAFADSLTIERMASLATAIDHAFEAISSPRGGPKGVSRGDWLDNLGANYLRIEQLPDEARNAFEAEMRTSGVAVHYDELVRAFTDPMASSSVWLRDAEPAALEQLLDAIDAGFRAVKQEPTRRAKYPHLLAGGEYSDLAGSGEAQDGSVDIIDTIKLLEHWIVSPPGPPRGEPWYKLVPRQALESLNNLRLKRFLAEYLFDSTRRRLVGMTLDFAAWEALSSLLRPSQPPMAKPFMELQHEYEFAVAHGMERGRLDPTNTLKLVSDSVGACVEDWRAPDRWRRLTREAAARAIDSVGDIQIAFEAILRDRWEQAPEPGTVGGDTEAAPYVYIPASSVGPIGDDPRDPWAARNGLERRPGPNADGGRGASIFVASGAPVDSDAA